MEHKCIAVGKMETEACGKDLCDISVLIRSTVDVWTVHDRFVHLINTFRFKRGFPITGETIYQCMGAS